MKKQSTSMLRFSTILGLVFLLMTCTQEAREELIDGYVDGVNLNLNTDIFQVPVSLYFGDANPDTGGEAPENLSITIAGPDKDLIYSTDGNRDLKPVAGFLEIGLDKEVIISGEDPLELTIIAEAPGYVKTVQNIVLYDTAFQFIPVNMVSLNNPPEGVSLQVGTTASDADGVVQDTAFTTPMVTGKQEQASVKLKQGTKVMNADGEELIGNIEVQLVHFDNRSEASLAAFPGGFTATNVVDENGNPMDPVEFVTAGFVALDMFVGNDEVTDFSEPVEVEVGINPETIDPETGQQVKEGDIIPIWSLDDNTGQWKHEGEAMVEKDADGNLTATMQITHLSWWNFDYFYNSCRWYEPVQLVIESDYDNYYEAPYLRGQLYDANTGRRFSYSRYFRAYNGQTINMYNIPRNRNLYLQVSERNQVIYTSPQFTTTCNSTTILDMKTFQPPSPLTLDVRFSGLCEGAGPDIIIRPDATIYFRQNNQRWEPLARIRGGQFSTSRLYRNEVYDFRLIYAGRTYDFMDIAVASQVLIVEDYRLEINLDNLGDRATIIVEDVIIPEEYCNILLGG
ncbi:MAG: hypothetical protein RIC19_00395 [Phaeodactylibacter sp.]|uniref:hypothetical protein n=1 Tax=Phaeodactylibacter sp. TaxID=1940289 RepID=UPI0032EDAEE7